MSSSLPMKDSTEDPEHPTSSFIKTKIILGSRGRGGWRPYILLPFRIAIDWRCPKCQRAIDLPNTGRMVCPRCCITVQEYPELKFIEPRNRREAISNWRQWIDEALRIE